MGKGDTEIKMEFVVAGAASANAITRSVYQNQNAAMKATMRQNDAMGASIRRVGRSVLYGLAGYAGVSGISSAISSLAQGMAQVISKRSEMEKAITPLVSLEDNAKRMGNIRAEVLGTSLAMGRSLEEVGRFYADLVGSTGNLSRSQRDELIKETKELAELTGSDLVNAQNLLTKSYQIYGKELKNVNQLQNKLMMTQDEGSIEFNEMALRLPELLQAGKVSGLSIDDVLGTVIGATRKSGSIEKTMTGLRNMFLIMEEGEERGVKLTGSYVNQLRQLQTQFKTNGPLMQKMFGREVIVHASSVTDAISDISRAIQELGKVTGETDSVAEKLATKFKDPTYFHVRDMENIKQVIEQAPNIAADLPESWLMKKHRRGLMGAAGFQAGTGGVLGPVGTVAGYINGLGRGSFADAGEQITASTRDGEFFKATMRQAFEEKKAADLDRMDLAMKTIPGLSSNPEAIAERERRANVQMSPHLMSANELATYRGQSGGSGKTEDSQTHDLLRETNRLLGELAQPATARKPGGAKTNYEESI
jgi:hypothetical protein